MPNQYLVALALAASACNASAQSPVAGEIKPAPTQTLSDAASWVQPKTVVPPEYPAGAAEKKITGHVDVDILVSEEGFPKEVRSISSTPKNEQFEDVVRGVIKQWTFHAALSNCKPVETVGNVRVWFDMKDDVGVVSVTNRAPPKAATLPGEPKSKIVSTNSAEVRASVKYPIAPRRAGAAGLVYVRFTVEPKSGSIASVEVSHAKSRPSGYEDEFAAVSKAAVGQFKIVPMPDRDTPVSGCVPFVFRVF